MVRRVRGMIRGFGKKEYGIKFLERRALWMAFPVVKGRYHAQ